MPIGLKVKAWNYVIISWKTKGGVMWGTLINSPWESGNAMNCGCTLQLLNDVTNGQANGSLVRGSE